MVSRTEETASDYGRLKVVEKEDCLEVSFNGISTVIDHEQSWILDVFPFWYVIQAENQKPYIRVERSVPNPFSSLRQKIMLHRLIFGIKGRESFEVDHVDRDTLNNRLSNLRLATPRQNAANRVSKCTNKTGFRGVTFKSGKYHVRIGNQKYRKHIGSFLDAKEAAMAYDKAAKEIYGEFAVVNFP